MNFNEPLPDYTLSEKRAIISACFCVTNIGSPEKYEIDWVNRLSQELKMSSFEVEKASNLNTDEVVSIIKNMSSKQKEIALHLIQDAVTNNPISPYYFNKIVFFDQLYNTVNE